MQQTVLLRIVAILLLLITGAGLCVCDVSDACATGTGTGCDRPAGDNCLCCCHHILPVAVLTLEPGEVVRLETPPEPVVQLLFASLPIDHPPQLQPSQRSFTN